jgi:hypothetical protein
MTECTASCAAERQTQGALHSSSHRRVDKYFPEDCSAMNDDSLEPHFPGPAQFKANQRNVVVLP